MYALRARTTVGSFTAQIKIHIAESEVLIEKCGETGFSSGLVRNYWPKLELVTPFCPVSNYNCSTGPLKTFYENAWGTATSQ